MPEPERENNSTKTSDHEVSDKECVILPSASNINPREQKAIRGLATISFFESSYNSFSIRFSIAN
jgi:hypothetical protein